MSGAEGRKTDKNMIQHNSSTINPQATPIYVNGKPVGRVERGTFKKVIDGSRHLLRQPKAIAFDRSTLRDAQAAGAHTAEIFDRETRTTYSATLQRVNAEGFPVHRGYGDQWALALDKWSANGQRPPADVRAAATNKEIAELQMSLFVGGAA